MDALDLEIQKARDEQAEFKAAAAEFERRKEEALAGLVRATLKLSHLELAARLRPIKAVDDGDGEEIGDQGLVEPTSKGRAPGSISHKWRNILKEMIILCPDGASEPEILEIARGQEGLEKLTPKNVRSRMLYFEGFKYVSQAGNRWLVADEAIRKFGLKGLGGEQAADHANGSPHPEADLRWNGHKIYPADESGPAYIIKEGPESANSPDPNK